MRKLFTRLISIFILIMVFVLQGFTQTFPVLGPSSDFTNIKKTDVFVLTASEKVVAGDGVIRLKDGATTLGAYQATNANVTIEIKDDKSTIKVDFSAFLAEEKNYTLEVDENFVMAQDNDEPNSDGTWVVSVGDYTAPMLASSNPLLPKNGETVAVQLDADLTIKFNEPVQVAAGGMLYIYTDNGTTHGDLYDVIETADVTGQMTNTLVINTNIDFKEKTKYYVTIPEGAIVDYNMAPLVDNQNKFAGWLTVDMWVFTTRDATAPTVSDIMADNIGATSFDVFTTLNKAGKVYVMAVPKGDTPVAADFIAANGMKEAKVTDPAASVKVSLTQYFDGGGLGMVEGDEYDVWVITENAETVTPTQSAPAKKLTVKTTDVTVPTVVTYFPLHTEAAATVDEGDYIYIVASEGLKVGTGDVEVYTWDADLNHTLLVSVPAASCMVTEKGAKDTLFIPVDKGLWVSEAEYFVKYTEGIATDMAGNKLAGISTTEDWKFIVQDFLAPTYTVVPANGTSGVSEVAPQIKITFNELLYSDATGTVMVDPLVGLSLKNSKGTAVTMTVASFDGQVIELNIDPAEVTSSASFELSIDTKKFFDASGNVGTTVDVVGFILKDYEGPVVTIEPVLVGASENILIKFDEPVLNADGTAVTDADVANAVIFRKGTTASGAIVSAAYSVAADAKSFIIDPTNDFTTPGDQYFVRLGAGAVEDAAGNPNLLAEQIVTVKDFIAPTAAFSGIGTSPVDPVAVAPVITFSEAMETLDGTAVGGDATDLVTVKENGENIPFTATWDVTDVDAPFITVTVATYLPSAEYSISIGKSLQDVAENKFMGVATTFTTMSDVAPAVSSLSPADGALQQANDVPLVVTFDQPVVAGAGTITFTGTSATVGTVSISGATVTIGHTSFVTNEVITVNIPAGYVKGVNNIDAPAVSWTFSTKETVKPAITIYSPTVGATGVPVGSKLMLTYSEKIVQGPGSIYIKDYATDVTVQTLSAVNCVIKNDDELEITPSAALAYNKQYYVEITEGFVVDVNGNKAVAMTGNATWNFTTSSNAGPFVVSSSDPADMDDKIAASKNPVTVTFNRDIKTGSASASAKIILFNVTDGLIVIEDAANTGRFTYTGSTLSINTASDIVANKEYTLTLEAGIVTDGFNTPNDADVITFYTYDNNGPEVVSTTPAKDATNVAKTTTISVTWDETPLLASDGSAISAAAIKANGLVTVNGGVAYTASVSGLQWTLTLDAPLAENVLNTVVVMQTMVKDAVDNTQPADYTWSFTTEDRTCNPPSNFLITEDTKGTEIKFTVDFDEKGKVYYQVLPAADAAPGADDLIASGSMIEFAAGGTSAAQTVSGLVSGGAYKAYFVAVDASANANQSTIYAPAEFNTVDINAPVVTAMEPMDGANDVAGDTDLMLWFDEEVVIGTGTVIIREVATDIAVGEIVVSAGNTALVTTDGKTKATITTGVTLASKTAYYVDVDGGTFEDLSGNGMAPIVGMDMWSFTTKDTVAPLLVKTLPDYAAATTPIIRKGTPLLIEFNEAMSMPTGVLYVRYATAPNGVFEVVNGNELLISGDMKTFAVEMMNVPAEQDEFYVDLSELVLKDTSDNQWIDILGTDWNFIIRDETAPAIATIDPANGEEGVVIDTDVEITFTEGIFKAPDATVFTATTIKDVISLKDAAGDAVDYDATLDVVDANSGVVTVTLTPKADLTSETEYMVTISPVVDIMKNVSGEIMSSFTTKDMTAPYVTMWDPDFDTEVNPETGVVTVTFSEKIYDDILVTEEGNVVLYPIEPENIPDFFSYNAGTPIRDADDKIVGFTAGASIGFTGTISEDMMVITLTPVSGDTPLASEAWYRVLLDEDVVVDKAGNFNEEDETIFRIEDTVKPTAIAYLPWGATAAGATMSIEFNEKIALGTGNIYVRNYVNGDVIETIPVADTTVRFDETGMIAIIKHMDFPPAKYMYVTADAGTITDASSNANPWDGIAIDAIDTWTFSTADFVKPGIVDGGLYPAPGATNVMLGTSIEITFDKEVMFNTDGIDRWMVIYNEDWTPYRTIKVDATNFTLRSITTPVYQANRILSFANANLAANSMYYVRIMEGSVKDVAGNTFAGIMDDSWSFTTGDSGAPKVVTLTPEDNATAVPHTTNLVMEFDREILPNAAGMIMLYKEEPGSLGTLLETIDPTSESVMIEGKVATITIYGVLEYETGYYVIVEPGAFTNTSVDRLPFAGITTTQGWNFRTAKLVCPEFNLVVTEVEQLECSAVVDISVEPEGDYVLTLNGDTIMAGVDTIPSGSYTVIAYTSDGDCMVEEMIEVGSEPVVRNETVDTNLGEAVHYMDEESGIDTMLYQGIHVLPYEYMECTRTLIVTVIEDIRKPTIAEVQGDGDESPLVGKLVQVTGTISAVAEGEGFFMQDANAAWSGIWVEFSLADYEGIQIGNGMQVVGIVAEVANVTTLTNVTLEFVPPLLDLAKTVLTSPSELEAEMWESVLVQVEGAQASAVEEATGEWTIYYEESDNAVVNDWLYSALVEEGKYYDVTGIVNGRLDNFKLEPRVEYDVVDLSITGTEDMEADVFKAYPNPFNDKILIDNSEKLTRVVISNIAGQRVIDIENPTREIRTAKLVSGIYVISLYTENGVAKTERMIKR